MKYYKLTFSSNIKEVGKIPQSEEGSFGDIKQDFIPWEGIIDVNFKLPEPNLEKKAKQTSLIHVAFIRSTFLVIDDQFLALLAEFNIGNYQDWKIQTWQNKQLLNKYNLFILNDTKQDKYIDFLQSEFYIRSYSSSSFEKETVTLRNYNEYVTEKERLRKDNLLLLSKNVTLDLREAKEDMFRLVNAPPGGYFVSEKLKDAIQKNGFNGMSFEEVSELKNIIVMYK